MLGGNEEMPNTTLVKRAVCVLCVQVTSKGAGLNPNAKVWQEMPAVPSEAPVDGSEASPWSQSNITEGSYENW